VNAAEALATLRDIAGHPHVNCGGTLTLSFHKDGDAHRCTCGWFAPVGDVILDA
jgi:hypothetical protein